VAEQKLHHIQASRWLRLGRRIGLGPNLKDSKIDKNA